MKRLALAVSLLVAAACSDSSPTEPKGATRSYAVGGEFQFNVEARDNKDSCKDAAFRTGRVVAVSQRAILIADGANPAGGFDQSDYDEIGRKFDQLVWPVVTRSFGEPSDIDRNDRVILFFTSAVNDLTPVGADSYVGGFYFARDLFPKVATKALQACVNSNEAELLYMLVPDPSRGGPFSKERVVRSTLGTAAHELQHLVNASRRLYVIGASGSEWSELTWLNEGLSHIAEELMFYAATGLDNGRNLTIDALRASPSIKDAANAYAISNFGRLEKFYENPENNGPYDDDVGSDLASRGAAWQFLRYTADQRSGSETAFWKQLVDSRRTGLANLRQALGADPMPILRNWSVAVLADDAVKGVQPLFAQPSWNYPSVLSALNQGVYPLKTRMLSNGATENIDLIAGGAAYLRFAIPAGGRAELKAAAGAEPAAPCTSIALDVGQVHTAEPSAAALLCIAGGAQGGEYALIPFYGSEVPDARIALQVSASGIAQATPLPLNLSRSAWDAPALSRVADVAGQRDERFEQGLRERERETLSRLVPGGGIRSSQVVSQTNTQAGVPLYLSVIRTR